MTTTRAVHPIAALFPMMGDDELSDLADDIKANGLLHPIVLDADGVLIDGRNRLAACERAGVEPQFISLNRSDNPAALILSANVLRRHLSKGQAAMAVAKASAFSESSLRALERSTGVSNSRIAYARVVLEYAPELVDEVMKGGSLNDAYEIALAKKRERDAEIQELADLSVFHPDVGDHVRFGEWSMSQARVVVEQRKLQEEARRKEGEAIRAHEVKRDELRKLREEVGSEVPITRKPDLSTIFAVPEVSRPPAPDLTGDQLDEQKRHLDALIKIKRGLQTMQQDSPAVDGWDAAGHVKAVRSAVSQIVEAAYAIAERHNVALLATNKIREVRRG